MRSLVYFTTRLPSKISDGLTAAGYRVLEALEISEVMYLCEHEDIDMVVIAPDVDEQDLVDIQLRRVTMKVKPEATARDILWELSNLFSDTEERIQ